MIVGCRNAFFGDDRLEFICGDSLWKGDKIRLCEACKAKLFALSEKAE